MKQIAMFSIELFKSYVSLLKTGYMKEKNTHRKMCTTSFEFANMYAYNYYNLLLTAFLLHSSIKSCLINYEIQSSCKDNWKTQCWLYLFS